MQSAVQRRSVSLASVQHYSCPPGRRVQPLAQLSRLTNSRSSCSGQCYCSIAPSTSQQYLAARSAAVRQTNHQRSCSAVNIQQRLATTPQVKQRSRTVVAAVANTTADFVRSKWTAPCGTVFEVIGLPAYQQQLQHHSGDTSTSKPPVVLIHGLFRAAWYWTETLLPSLAAAGYDSYAISLRGQGSSQLVADPQSASSSSKPAQHPFTAGVPLTVNVADIGAFINSRRFTQPPILVGHSLGGMFVQEYLHSLLWQQQQQQQDPAAAAVVQEAPTTPAAAAAAALPHIEDPLPPLSGAVLLASACAGTVMSFGRFIADVGVLEFMYQMYIVLSHAHLNDISTARYCWWQDDLSQSDAEKYLAQIKNSSAVLPYITAEVGGWYPPAPSPDDLKTLPPVLALGGSADRIIRPFQVTAAGEYWGAEVRVLNGVTHDVLLGPQAVAVSQEIVSWMQAIDSKSRLAVSDAAALADWPDGSGANDVVEPSVGRLV